MFMTQAQIGSQIWGIGPPLTGSLLVTEPPSLSLLFIVSQNSSKFDLFIPTTPLPFCHLKAMLPPLERNEEPLNFWSILSFSNHLEVDWCHRRFPPIWFLKIQSWKGWWPLAELMKGGGAKWTQFSLYSEPLHGHPSPNSPQHSIVYWWGQLS